MRFVPFIAGLLFSVSQLHAATQVQQVAQAGDYDTVSSTLFTPDPVLLTGTDSNRIALFEFPLINITPGQQLDSAKLSFRINGYSGGPDSRFIQFAISGYAGNGVITASDASATSTLLGTGRFDYNGTSGAASFSGDSLVGSVATPFTLTLDVTSLATSLIGQGASYIGLKLQPVSGTTPNSAAVFFFGNSGAGGTQTTISTVTSVPESGTCALFGLGAIGLYLLRRRKEK